MISGARLGGLPRGSLEMQPSEATKLSSLHEDDFFLSLQVSKTEDGTKKIDAYLSCSVFSCLQAVCQAQHAPASVCSMGEAVQHSRSHFQPTKSMAKF